MRGWWCLWMAMAVVAACDDDEPIAPGPVCPNAVPADGQPCGAPGLVCNYFTSCELFFVATCTPAGVWSFEDQCPEFGGGGMGGTGGAGGSGASAGTGGTGGTTTSSAGGAGGAGGSGGAGGAGGS